MKLFDVLKKAVSSNATQAAISVTEKQGHGKLVEEEYCVVGVSYYLQNLKELSSSNPDWRKNAKSLIASGKVGKRIFRYSYIYKPVKLIPEPKNSHDKNAIMVQIAGEKVGYISTDDNVHVKNVLSTGRIKFISAYITGGEYKIVDESGDVFKGENQISINVKIGYSK